MREGRNNILYIFNDVNFGGAGLSLIDILTQIKNDINPVVVIREEASLAVRDKFNELGIRFYEIPFSIDYVKVGCANDMEKRADLTQSYEAALQLLPIIEKEKIDLIHINSSVSYFAAIAALMAAVPYVWHIRELMEEQFGCEFINKVIKQRLYRYADRVIAISNYVKRKYAEKYLVQSHVLYDGLDIKKYALNIDESLNFENVFLVAAFITPEKGQWDAICATEILVKKGYTDIQLIIVGDVETSYTWALKKYIKRKRLEQNICILPFQSDLSKLHKRASYAITCSQNEALGRVTIEAMLAGNLVIGAKSGGTVEIIGEKEERGFLYELRNSESLADAMIRAMQCPEEVKQQTIRMAKAYAEETFDSVRYCKQLTDMYDEVISIHQEKGVDDFLDELKAQYERARHTGEMRQKKDERFQKSEAVLCLVMKWLKIKQQGQNLEEYFKQKKIRSIAIYGMADLGCRLYDELEQGEVRVKYLLDKNPGGKDVVFDFVSLDGKKMEVDAIVVTVARAERQVVDEIKARGYRNVLGLSEILNGIEIQKHPLIM